MTRDGSTWCRPKERTPGVSMTQPSPPGSGSAQRRGGGVPAAAGDRVDMAGGAPAVLGDQRVDQRRLADAGVADERGDLAVELLAHPVHRRAALQLVAAGDDVGDAQRRRTSPGACPAGPGPTWSAPAAGSRPPSYAATRQRSIRRGRGSGSARAVTMASWSALATTTRSYGSSSSAVRRRTEVRSSMRTMRARVSFLPDRSPTMADPVADHRRLAAQLAGLHRRDDDGPRRGR